MSPSQQRLFNIAYFNRALANEASPERRDQILRLLADEHVKPDSAYPAHSVRGPR